ncbi:hypothetical protein KDK95_28215 [Actinospica sp. MGRD01-02]|uniref:Uncharacterized protein n=1 Tax=Actinospica acidithermotolerans TaxID=2828514 RepID=A0A941EEX7_9ACTN|nr:hypothetical protein [Actinospica acidithermotolerans]MBR7830221.1 hypothetical protein [Actinospica acidithermotolerans]
MSSCLTYQIDGPAESSRPSLPLPLSLLLLPLLLLGSSIGTDVAMWAAPVPVLARDRALWTVSCTTT